MAKFKVKNIDEQTVTDSDGCYAFNIPVSLEKGTITIELRQLVIGASRMN
jgi:hypothetical protein